MAELLAVLALIVLVAGVGYAVWRVSNLRRLQTASRVPTAVESPPQDERLGPLGLSLKRDADAGRHDAVLRRLDQELPEWPASATLIEAARDLFALQAEVTAAKAAHVPDTITNRLTEEIAGTADLLWRRADRLAAAGLLPMSSPRLGEDLERQDEQLQRLHQSIRDTRTELSALMLAGAESPQALSRAANRFQALANTARELSDLDREALP